MGPLFKLVGEIFDKGFLLHFCHKSNPQTYKEDAEFTMKW